MCCAVILELTFLFSVADEEGGDGHVIARVAGEEDMQVGEEDQKLTQAEKAVLVRALHRVLRPFILRRVKDDVAKDLPVKVRKGCL